MDFRHAHKCYKRELQPCYGHVFSFSFSIFSVISISFFLAFSTPALLFLILVIVMSERVWDVVQSHAKLGLGPLKLIVSEGLSLVVTTSDTDLEYLNFIWT